MNYLKIFLLGCFLWMVMGCTARTNQGSVSENIDTLPTVNSMFSSVLEKRKPEEVGNVDLSLTGDSLSESPSSQATITLLPTLTLVPPIETRIETIYDENLNANWTLDNTREVIYDLRDDTFSYEGDYSLAFTPKVAYADLAFTVNEDADGIYLRDDVLAVRFWLYSGDDYIETDDLAAYAVGSNEYPYWVFDDDSVTVDDGLSLYPPARLYFLDVEEDIPPDTWLQIEFWLDEQVYDPEYEYVTGFFLKNDEDFFRTVYIDEVELLIREN